MVKIFWWCYECFLIRLYRVLDEKCHFLTFQYHERVVYFYVYTATLQGVKNEISVHITFMGEYYCRKSQRLF